MTPKQGTGETGAGPLRVAMKPRGVEFAKGALIGETLLGGH